MGKEKKHSSSFIDMQFVTSGISGVFCSFCQQSVYLRKGEHQLFTSYKR